MALTRAFDLDGTLVDSKDAVVEAYVRAGIQREDVLKHWGKPWNSWCAQEVHERKNLIYEHETIKMVARLPAMEFFENKFSLIVTSASLNAVEIVCKKFHLRPRSIFPELTPEGKANLLDGIFPGILFEDDEDCVKAVRARGKWAVMQCHFLK